MRISRLFAVGASMFGVVAATSAAASPARPPDATPLPPHSLAISLPFPPGSAGSAGGGPGELAVSRTQVWASDGLFRIGPKDAHVRGPLDRGESSDMGAGTDSVWASDFDADVVRRYDTAGRLAATVHVPAGTGPEGIAVTSGAVWVAGHERGSLLRIDPLTNRVVATVSLVPAGQGGPQFVAYGLHSVWVGVPSDNQLVRVDPVTDRVTARITLPDSTEACGGIAIGSTAVWISQCLDGHHLAQVDPRTNRVVDVRDVGGEILQPAADGDTVWYVVGGDPDSDPASTPSFLVQQRADGSIAHRYAVGAGFSTGSVVVAFGDVWASSFREPIVYRVPYPGAPRQASVR